MVGLMMWMWLSTIVVLVGRCSVRIEHRCAPPHQPKPLGTRVMADTGGAAKA